MLTESDAPVDPARVEIYTWLDGKKEEFFQKYGEYSGLATRDTNAYHWLLPARTLEVAVHRLRTGKRKSLEAIALKRALDDLGIPEEKLTSETIRPWHNKVFSVIKMGWRFVTFRGKQDPDMIGMSSDAFDRWAENARKDVGDLENILEKFGKYLKELEVDFRAGLAQNKYTPDSIRDIPYSPVYSVDDPLGAYAFSPQRNKETAKTPPPEDNTELEDKLHAAFREHMLGKTPIDRETAEVVLGLIDGGLYQDVFDSCDNCGSVYRGLGVNEKFVTGVLGYSPDEIIAIKNEGKYLLEGDWVLSNRGGAYSSSWTTRYDSAEHFSYKSSRGGKYSFSLVIEAQPSDNPRKFIDISDFAFKVALGTKKQSSMLSGEEEIVGLGDIKFSRVYIVRAGLK